MSGKTKRRCPLSIERQRQVHIICAMMMNICVHKNHTKLLYTYDFLEATIKNVAADAAVPHSGCTNLHKTEICRATLFQCTAIVVGLAILRTDDDILRSSTLPRPLYFMILFLLVK